MYPLVAWEAIIHHAPHQPEAAFTQGERDNRANDDTTYAAKRYAFQKHAIPKKCHL